MRLGILAAVTIFMCSVAVSQTKKTAIPCEYSGALLRDITGAIVQFKSDYMKASAIYKEDVDAATKQIDAKGTVLVEVVVNPEGQVVCTKAIVGHPILSKPIQRALKKWTFATVGEQGGKRVGYTGLLQFSLCNISCGDGGYSMSILK